jgi:large subunit ribosomal protein L21e
MSKMFHEYRDNDNVTIVRDSSVHTTLPIRISGKTGKIIGKKGKFYIVALKDFNKTKHFIINAVNLKPVK